VKGLKKIGLICRMIKIEHSVFALPFAYSGLFWASKGWPGWAKFVFLTVAMVSIRSFAMAVNRLVDLDLDRNNPRTQNRPLVTGEIGIRECIWFSLGCALIFVAACAFLNKLCLVLAPFALIWSGLYSLSKRFTWWCHFWLGSVLGLAPVAGWIAKSPYFGLASLLLGCGVMFWVAGFDIFYSLQDREFDRSQGLFSIPAQFGASSSLAMAKLSHFTSILFLLLAGLSFGAGWIYFLTIITIGLILFLEHVLIAPDNLQRINLVFFTFNGFVAILFVVGVILDLYIKL